ncbi:hypothetical protein A2524_01930 [Candidatus Wolfebacteria bacterium RIFOXYD12_FULL_48_21]|uniref:LemA family protein n=1 Tax=Candidatus Wolfebacteria bacterium RIFOXYD1_FULL_48_65 TaxID=1802561 RepID=A0A1F8E103_9BACT|nr:MAG: hypothetical protein A2610_03905 [Candidatus Wolfebacteria bacterium RIFOXYD1_FULL_48_65]OGM94554.1 MAG: hypothetical protein A2524_01930 [Candidatus Wolfebacteria bacterium RIFOXYD12_FULL_48_21]OGM97747.1 MAG: hypothetical protein A2532_03835 [Candidatus Wolfebacteria bacterium RIFOXYD2_FULL_48_11]
MITTTNIVLLVAGALILWIVFVFNGLIRLRFRVREAWSDIEVQLKRRYDLIPNLIETVKGYMVHEKDVFEKVTQARAQSLSATGHTEKGAAEGELTSTLKTLFAVSENYPELKANTNFMELQRELSDTENKIQAARRFYNGNVMEYNTRIHVFPSNIIAKLFKFTIEEFFQLEDKAAKDPVKVSF